MPVISEYKDKRSQDEVRELVDGVAGTFGVMLFVVTVIGVIAAPLIIFAFAPGWHDEPGQFDLARRHAALDLPLSILHLADARCSPACSTATAGSRCPRSRR